MKTQMKKILYVISVSLISIVFFSCASATEEKNDSSSGISNSKDFSKWEYRGYLIEDSELNVFLFLIEGNISNIKVVLNDDIKPLEAIKESEKLYKFRFNNLKNGLNSIRISDDNMAFSATIKNQPFDGQIIDTNTSFTIQVNQEVKIKKSGMTIRLISLSRDSRCEDPLDKFSCMHDPKTYITFQMSAPKYTPESMTIQKPQTEIAGGVFHDFPFSIEEIEPSPQKNKVIGQSKYKVTMKVH
jgi:hypothetical protein